MTGSLGSSVSERYCAMRRVEGVTHEPKLTNKFWTFQHGGANLGTFGGAHLISPDKLDSELLSLIVNFVPHLTNTTEALSPVRLSWSEEAGFILVAGSKTHFYFQPQSPLHSQWQLPSSAPPPKCVGLAQTMFPCLFSQGRHPRCSASSARHLNFNIHPSSRE